jgi:hypothetical protein
VNATCGAKPVRSHVNSYSRSAALGLGWAISAPEQYSRLAPVTYRWRRHLQHSIVRQGCDIDVSGGTSRGREPNLDVAMPLQSIHVAPASAQSNF